MSKLRLLLISDVQNWRMILEISILAAIIGCALLRYGLPGCFSPRIIVGNLFHRIRQQLYINNAAPSVAFPTASKAKGKLKRKRTKQKKSESNANESIRKRNCSLSPNTRHDTPRSIPRTVSQAINLGTIPKSCSSQNLLSASMNQADLDKKARNRELFSTKKAKEPFTFRLDEFGGFVQTPYLKLIFLSRAVLRKIEITVSPQYKWKDGGEGKLRMTPEIYFTSKDEMKFLRPVEVHLETHLSATGKKEPIAVEIERTEHCVPPKWLKIQDVEFHKGLIKFFMNQFCGVRAVCNSCQKSITSSRISYSLSVRDSTNVGEMERKFYLHVYTDTPDQREQVAQEMNGDGYNRIHPTQKFTVRQGCDLIALLSSSGLHFTPPSQILNMGDDIIMEAVMFRLHGSLIATSDLPIHTQVAEILARKTTHMSYSAESVTPRPRNLNLTINGGSMIQTNFNVGQVNQENVAPLSVNQAAEANPEEFALGFPSSQALSTNSPRSNISAETAVMPSRYPTTSACQLPVGVLTTYHLDPHPTSLTDPKEPYAAESAQRLHAPQTLANGQHSSNVPTVPKMPYTSNLDPTGLRLPLQEAMSDLSPGLSTAPKAKFVIGSPRMAPPSVQVYPSDNRAFTVHEVPETEPKVPWRPEDGDVRFCQSTPYGRKSQLVIHSPSPISTYGSLSTVPSNSSHSIPESTSHPAFLVPRSESHPGYTQTIGRGDFFQRCKPYQRSAFSLVRNSSHPSLSTFDFRPLSFDPSEVKDEANEDDLGLLFSLPEEEQGLSVPCNPSTDYSDEVSKALANATPYKPPAPKDQESKQSIFQASEMNPTQNKENSPQYVVQERPSAISSGFGSGLTTRNTSACTDVVYEASPVEKLAYSPTHRDEGSRVSGLKERMRRSVSLSDPRELEAILCKVKEKAVKADQSTQTLPKKTYSDALKSPGRNGMQISRTSLPTRIPGLCKGRKRRNLKQSKKL